MDDPASVTVDVSLSFQILTQEDWNAVLYNGMASTTPLAALYFVALMTFGNYVLFNLLVAILVEGFQAEVRGHFAASAAPSRAASATPFWRLWPFVVASAPALAVLAVLMLAVLMLAVLAASVEAILCCLSGTAAVAVELMLLPAPLTKALALVRAKLPCAE